MIASICIAGSHIVSQSVTYKYDQFAYLQALQFSVPAVQNTYLAFTKTYLLDKIDVKLVLQNVLHGSGSLFSLIAGGHNIITFPFPFALALFRIRTLVTVCPDLTSYCT